jgi:hypothetical protein
LSNSAAVTSSFVVVVVLALLNQNFIGDEHDDEKNQIRSHVYGLRFFLFTAFPPGRWPLWLLDRKAYNSEGGGRIPDTQYHVARVKLRQNGTVS